MFANINCTNPRTTAWTNSVHTRKDQLFVKIQCKLTKALKSAVDAGTCEFVAIGIVVHGYYKDIEFLWDLVHHEAVRRSWVTFDEDSEMKSRSHSATLFRSLEEYVAWVRCDPRLVFYQQPQGTRVSCFFPWKSFDPSFICPPGVNDATDVVGSHAARIGTYQLWLMRMHQEYPHVRVLESTGAMDITDLKQFPVLPLRIVKDVFVAVFVPAFMGHGEPNCQIFNLGKMIFGARYRVGGKFDVLLRGYWFAVPSLMVKQDSTASMFFLRTCRLFDKPNTDSEPFECCVDASLTFSARQCLLDMSTGTFSFAQTPTLNKFIISNKAFSHP